MSFDHIHGQPVAVETLTRALSRGLVHHAYRFEGLDGVGKELTALALAQALLCTDGDPFGCGRCDACRRAMRGTGAEARGPVHPDLIYLGRGYYPPEALGGRKETAEISIEQVRRVVLSRASYGPHEGRAQVFIVRAADELSTSAANALLKTLEEPRPATYFVLLSSRPEKLLPTIRSRSLPVRFGPLADEVIARILTARGVGGDRIANVLALAGGSAAAAIEAADPELGAERDDFVAALLGAVAAPDLGEAVAFSERAERDRKRLVEHLSAVAAVYHRQAASEVARSVGRAELAARRHALVLDAIAAVERNGSSALVITSLVASLRHAYLRRPGTPPRIALARR